MTLVGTVGIGLTILLFISVIEQTSRHRSKPSGRAIVHVGREYLEKNHEWSAQDRWRISHLFVPHKPAEQPKNILIDSRLKTLDATSGRWNAPSGSLQMPFDGRPQDSRDLEVRLDISRPKKAAQGQRLVAQSSPDSRSRVRDRSGPRMHFRDPRLLVQASWEFGPECCQNEYVSVPIRRMIPVPRPEPELPLFPVRKAVPDIAFEMAMFRHFTVSGLFPPGSHIVSQSDRSVFPMIDPRSQNELVSFGDHRWQQSEIHRHHLGEEATPYAGIGVYDTTSERHQTSDEHDQRLSSAVEIDLRVELITPHSVSSGKPHESILLVRNEGPDAIPRIEVQDLISKLQTVVAAEPEAMTETKINLETGSHDKLLHREIQGLVPGDGQEFSLRWIPEGGRRHIHRARVIAQAAVSTTTEVNPPDPDQQMPSIPPETPPEKHPALAVDVNYQDKAFVGDDIEMQITVRNTGDTTLHNVQVKIELPSQLSHRDGTHLLFDAGNLLVRGRNQTILKMSATQAGDAVNVLQVAAAEHVQAHGRTSILVVERAKEPAPLAPTPEPVRSKPQTILSPGNKRVPQPQQPIGECCCQRVPVIRHEPGTRIP